MKIKNTENLRLHATAQIKEVTQDQEKPNTLYISGYASLFMDEYGFKEVDRDYEIVNVDGMDIESFKRNPVLLWNHDWNEVRGRVTSIVKDAKGLLVTAEMQRLTGKEADFENVLHGNVKSFSIGFIPKEYEYLDDAVEITQSELLELSIAPVQSNRGALFQVVGTKSMDVDSKSLKEILEQNKRTIEVDVNKKEPEVTPVVEPKAEPEVKPTEPVKTEPEAKVEPKVDVKVENNIDPQALAEALQAAQRAADEAKAEADKVAEEAKVKAEEDAKAEAEQKVQDVYTYIREKKDEFANMSVQDLDTNAEQLDEFVDLITETNEVIVSKVQELITQSQVAPSE